MTPRAQPTHSQTIAKGHRFFYRRNGVTIPSGFEIFRTYLGTEYRAHSIGGLWCRQDSGDAYSSLNQLSASLGTTENVWEIWLYVDETGE
jgi:hypothetical protein